jgi:hypothetical protein
MEAPPLTHAAHVLPVNGSDMVAFARIMMGLAEQASDNKTISIDASTYKCTSYGVQPTVKKGGEGRLIGLTKGGMHTKLHAITDTSGRPIRFFITAGLPLSDASIACRATSQ